MRRWHTVVAALLTLAGPRIGAAQGAVTGTWITEFPINLRIIDGVESSDGTGRARISLHLKGDSVLGTWLEITAGGKGRSRSLRGLQSGGRVRLETDPPDDRVLNINGEEESVKMRTRYDFAVAGDSLVGTMQAAPVDHSMAGPSRPFAAKREGTK